VFDGEEIDGPTDERQGRVACGPALAQSQDPGQGQERRGVRSLTAGAKTQEGTMTWISVHTRMPLVRQWVRVRGGAFRDEPGGLDTIATWNGFDWDADDGVLLREQQDAITDWAPLDPAQ
jgi:hypothetical protein